ncbi:hypothetical protein D3C75_1007070 [compost metagenome]
MKQHFLQAEPVEISCRHIILLLVSGQRRLLTSGKTKQTVRHDPVVIRQVADHLLDAPFFRGVPVASLLFGEPLQQRKYFFGLLAENSRQIPLRRY